MIAQGIYFLCLLASGICAWLLFRSYLQSRTPLLFWSAVCFLFLALNNLLVVADFIVFPSMDLILLRRLAALLAVSSLLYGFVWKTE